MLNGLVCGEVLTDGDKRHPFIAHQVSAGVDLVVARQHQAQGMSNAPGRRLAHPR